MRYFILLAILFPSLLIAQEKTEKVSNTFFDNRIIHGQSVESVGEGNAKFIISHRFGPVNGGISELFGLDASTIRLGLDYGITDWLDVGIGRSSFEKTYDGFIKMRLMQQRNSEKKSRFSISWFSSIAVNTLPWEIPDRENFFSSRLVYTHQVLIAKKFGDRFSLQISPSVVHRNLVATVNENNDVFSLGIAPRIRLSQGLSLSAEYFPINQNKLADDLYSSLALGLNFKTNGHAFQLHFGNSTGMIEKFFITETTGNIADGDIRFGFNIIRDFKFKGRQY